MGTRNLPCLSLVFCCRGVTPVLGDLYPHPPQVYLSLADAVVREAYRGGETSADIPEVTSEQRAIDKNLRAICRYFSVQAIQNALLLVLCNSASLDVTLSHTQEYDRCASSVDFTCYPVKHKSAFI